MILYDTPRLKISVLRMKDKVSKSQRALQQKNLENGQATDAKVNILPR